jgi:hypothetical protein
MGLISGLTSHSGQIKGDDSHVGNPGPPGGGWAWDRQPQLVKKNYGEKISKMLGTVLINRRLCGYKERDLIIGMWNTRLEGTKWELGKIETPFEEGQGPEGAVAPYTDGWILRTKHGVNLKNTRLCNCIYRSALGAVCNAFSSKQAWSAVCALL